MRVLTFLFLLLAAATISCATPVASGCKENWFNAVGCKDPQDCCKPCSQFYANARNIPGIGQGWGSMQERCECRKKDDISQRDWSKKVLDHDCICRNGYYGQSSLEPCKKCPEGTYGSGNNGFGTMNEMCQSCPSCPAGQYLSDCGRNNPGQCEKCKDCKSGEYQKTKCGADNPGQCEKCKDCDGGKIRKNCGGTSAGECVCPSGKYDDGGICKKCEDRKCASGYYNDVNSCRCKACRDCAASGENLVACSGNTGPGTCACDTGFYGSAAISSCTKCPDGASAKQGAGIGDGPLSQRCECKDAMAQFNARQECERKDLVCQDGYYMELSAMQCEPCTICAELGTVTTGCGGTTGPGTCQCNATYSRENVQGGTDSGTCVSKSKDGILSDSMGIAYIVIGATAFLLLVAFLLYCLYCGCCPCCRRGKNVKDHTLTITVTSPCRGLEDAADELVAMEPVSEYCEEFSETGQIYESITEDANTGDEDSVVGETYGHQYLKLVNETVLNVAVPMQNNGNRPNSVVSETSQHVDKKATPKITPRRNMSKESL